MHDQSKLIITFSLLTAYMMYSQLFVIWYENMPEETRYLVPRMNWVTNWPAISIWSCSPSCTWALWCCLLRRSARGNAAYSESWRPWSWSAMWVERWWLVMPSLDEPLGFGLSEIVAASWLSWRAFCCS